MPRALNKASELTRPAPEANRRHFVVHQPVPSATKNGERSRFILHKDFNEAEQRVAEDVASPSQHTLEVKPRCPSNASVAGKPFSGQLVRSPRASREASLRTNAALVNDGHWAEQQH